MLIRCTVSLICIFLSCCSIIKNPELAREILIRVHNNDNVDFDQVTVRFPKTRSKFPPHSETFGAVAKGQKSEYRAVPVAYYGAVVNVWVNDKEYVNCWLIDNMMEPFNPGYYTYELSLAETENVLSLRLNTES